MTAPVSPVLCLRYSPQPWSAHPQAPSEQPHCQVEAAYQFSRSLNPCACACVLARQPDIPHLAYAMKPLCCQQHCCTTSWPVQVLS